MKSLCSPEEIIQSVRANAPLKMVFTNGCFDVLHLGHIRYLQEAKALGNVLVVGLNSDASVKKIKGDQRPINSLKDRAEFLLALSCVDFVTSFEQETPLELIKTLQPHVLTKGGDWSEEKIVGASEVVKAGGKVYSLSFSPEFSTTKLVKRMGGFT